MRNESPRYLSCAETAKLVRKALKQTFPATKFSVVSHVYSMGASIRVRWTDGPTAKRVDEVVGVFSGAGFDGMIDLKYHVDHWLAPDGTVTVAHTSGTEGSRGTVPAVKQNRPHDDAELVSFGADYVFTERAMSDAFWNRVATAVGKYWGVDVPARKEAHSVIVKHAGGNSWGSYFSDLVYRAAENHASVIPGWGT